MTLGGSIRVSLADERAGRMLETCEEAARSAASAEALMGARPRDRIADEQAALRRVAVLVARGETPEQVFAAVSAEAGQLLDADMAAVGRYSSGSVLTIVARWSAAGDQGPGGHTRLGGRNAGTLVFETESQCAWMTFPAFRARRRGRPSAGNPIECRGADQRRGPAVGRRDRVKHE